MSLGKTIMVSGGFVLSMLSLACSANAGTDLFDLAHEAKVISGTITAVDVEKKTFAMLAVDENGDEQNYLLEYDNNTKFYLNGKKVEPEKILVIDLEIKVKTRDDKVILVAAESA